MYVNVENVFLPLPVPSILNDICQFISKMTVNADFCEHIVLFTVCVICHLTSVNSITLPNTHM